MLSYTRMGIPHEYTFTYGTSHTCNIACSVNHVLFGNGVWQRCYGGDRGYSLWKFAGKVTYQRLLLRVQPLCFVWLIPSDATNDANFNVSLEKLSQGTGK